MMTLRLRYIALWLGALCLACASCSDESIPSLSVSKGNGQVRIAYRVAGSNATTRAGLEPEDEAGWAEWNENTIKRLDLFVFETNGTLHTHIPQTVNVTDTQSGDYTNFVTEKLTYEEVMEHNYTYYLIANCQLNESITTLDALKAAMIQTKIDFDDKQASFAMDAKGRVDKNEEAETVTITFDLQRAAAKIRLAVQDVNGQSLLNDCHYLFYHYVEDGTSVLSEMEAYAMETGQTLLSTPEEPESSFTQEQQYDSKAVFYTYPNDWFDYTVLNEDGLFREDGIYAKDNLINEDRQTYFIVKAPYNDKEYYYKVPVLPSISQDNDKANFTKDEIRELRNKYYRLQRNYIYDITATIDREGGTESEPVELTNLDYSVNGWKDEEIIPPAVD